MVNEFLTQVPKGILLANSQRVPASYREPRFSLEVNIMERTAVLEKICVITHISDYCLLK